MVFCAFRTHRRDFFRTTGLGWGGGLAEVATVQFYLCARTNTNEPELTQMKMKEDRNTSLL